MKKIITSNSGLSAIFRRSMAFMLALITVCSLFVITAPTAEAAASGTGNYRITTTAGVNMRSGPGTNYRKVTAIPYNTTVSVTSTSGVWGKTTYRGYTGWFSLDYAQKITTSSNSGSRPLADGKYHIATSLNTGKVLDCDAWSTSNGANILLWEAHYGTNQTVTLTYLNNGYYKIVFNHSGKCLDVSGCSTSSGANVHQWDYVGGTNQQWLIKSAGNGYYYVIARHSGKYLDVSGGSSANGANIQVYDGNGTAAQKFRFIPAGSVSSNSNNNSSNTTSAWRWPVSNFYLCGNDWSEYYSYKGGDHLGVDIKSSTDGGKTINDRNIYAASAGTVVKAGWNSANGYSVVIEHTVSGRKVYSFYGHLSSISVSQTQSVKMGQKIGVIGNTGSSSRGAHLHFAISTQAGLGTWGYGSVFSNSANKVSTKGYTYYNPYYVINNGKLPA